MPLVDHQGRLFGRLNLIDALVLVTLVGLLPMAYAAALLFRPARPGITSVTRTEVDNADRRLARGTVLAAKLKIIGSGFTPMLRASVGNTPALAFVFEHPNSADVLVGAVPPGAHDLVLYDGVQEVARASKAVVIDPPATESVRLSGWASGDPAFVRTALTPGFRFPEHNHAFEVIAVGREFPASTRISFGGRHTDLERVTGVQRPIVLHMRCDPAPPDAPCAIAGIALGGSPGLPLDLPAPNGSFRFFVDEVFPPTPPVQVRVRVAFDAAVAGFALQDKDQLLDERAATVRHIARSGPETVVTFELGADRSRDGWRYRGGALKTGADFAFTTETYLATGKIRDVVPKPSDAEHR